MNSFFHLLLYGPLGSVVGFIAGFCVSRFTMSKKDRKDHRARLQDNSRQLADALAREFERFATSMGRYVNTKGSPTFDDFVAIATTGEAYFSQVRNIADYILSDNVDERAIGNTHIPIVKDAVEKTLPAFYRTLQDVASKNKFEFHGELKEETYASIYAVYRANVGEVP